MEGKEVGHNMQIMFCEDRVGQQGFKAGISVVIWGRWGCLNLSDAD